MQQVKVRLCMLEPFVATESEGSGGPMMGNAGLMTNTTPSHSTTDVYHVM